jgi:hypothetical protein
VVKLDEEGGAGAATTGEAGGGGSAFVLGACIALEASGSTCGDGLRLRLVWCDSPPPPPPPPPVAPTASSSSEAAAAAVTVLAGGTTAAVVEPAPGGPKKPPIPLWRLAMTVVSCSSAAFLVGKVRPGAREEVHFFPDPVTTLWIGRRGEALGGSPVPPTGIRAKSWPGGTGPATAGAEASAVLARTVAYPSDVVGAAWGRRTSCRTASPFAESAGILPPARRPAEDPQLFVGRPSDRT